MSDSDSEEGIERGGGGIYKTPPEPAEIFRNGFVEYDGKCYFMSQFVARSDKKLEEVSNEVVEGDAMLMWMEKVMNVQHAG